MIGLAIAGIAGLSALGALFGYKKKQDEENKPPPSRIRAGAVVQAAAALAPGADASTSVTPDKMLVLKQIVGKLLMQVPVTDAERANAINTAIAAGLPALAAALRSGSLLDIAKAAAGL